MPNMVFLNFWEKKYSSLKTHTCRSEMKSKLISNAQLARSELWKPNWKRYARSDALVAQWSSIR